MQDNLITYILGASAVSGGLGFMTACLMSARTVRRAEREGWKAAVRFYQDRKRRGEETF